MNNEDRRIDAGPERGRGMARRRCRAAARSDRAPASGLAAAKDTTRAQSYDDIRKGEAALSDPGPNNAALDAINKDSVTPPPTDHGSVPEFWHSFSPSHRRVEQGGWARQVNEVDFPLSKAIASVNMRLDSGGVRELHRHDAAEGQYHVAGQGPMTVLATHSDARIGGRPPR